MEAVTGATFPTYIIRISSMSVPETPAFIDFEASSLDLIASYPIEVGVCMPDGSLHSWLIAPHVLWRDWSESAEAIHGISLETLKREGRQIQDVAQELNALIKGPVYCDAWTFDSFWQETWRRVSLGDAHQPLGLRTARR